jgi:hypothetical protein
MGSAGHGSTLANMARTEQPTYMLRWQQSDVPRYNHFLLWPLALRMKYEDRAAVYEFDGKQVDAHSNNSAL